MRTLFLQPKRARRRAWFSAMVTVLAGYAAVQLLLGLLLGVSPNLDTVPRDLAAHLLVGAVLFSLARDFRAFAIAFVALLLAFHLSNALKVAILGAPIMPDDFVSVRNLFMLVDGWRLAGIVLMVAVPSLLLVRMIEWRKPRVWTVFGVTAAVTASLVLFPQAVVNAMDTSFGNSVWNQRGNYESRGLVIHLVQETARNLTRRTRTPGPADVDQALATLGGSSSGSGLKVALEQGEPSRRRNLHMIVLESFWDPSPLAANAGFSEDPLDPAFRELWAAAGNSHALSPVFGGYTANAEFEALCGFPVTVDSVFFEGRLRRDVPCLPAHLEAAGYDTYASHPNVAAFWNRINAYRRIGFKTYWADKDFVLDDMNREFLSDASLYRQVLEKLGPALRDSTPVFDYVLTYFGHVDYPLNAQRPSVVRTRNGDSLLERYANTLYYKSRELMTFIDRLRREDPDGLIVLFGDHLPFLGPNHAEYTDAGVLARNRNEFTDSMFRDLVSTPLIVIDGTRGPLAVGDMPMFRLPALILALLGDDRPSPLTLTAAKEHGTTRPLPGMHFVLAGDQVRACRDDDTNRPDCADSRNWLDAVDVITRDLFGGNQHTLHRLQAAPSLRAAGTAAVPVPGSA